MTVRDGNNTTSSAKVNIDHPTKLNLSVSAGSITAVGGTTSVTVTATGGRAPYTVTGPTSNVKAGTYTYTVTDAAGCTAGRTLTITEPAPGPVANPVVARLVTWKDVSCHGGSDGSATMELLGGVPPFTISWSTNPAQTGLRVTNLSRGTYTMTVRDGNNTTSIATVNIDHPTRLNLNVNAGSITVTGGTTQVSVSATGGRAPYTFTGPTNVRAGTYTYTVTDAAGCSTSRTLTITQPAALITSQPVTLPPLVLKAESGSIKCFGGVTSVNLRISGGLPPYRIKGDTVGVKAGTYTYMVTDYAGNSVSQILDIAEPDKLQLKATPGIISTIGGSTDVRLTPSGGVAPYTYIGNTYAVPAGEYTYLAMDANGCKSDADVKVREPAVKLSSFDLAKGDTSISLRWSTAYEYAIDHFEIERSDDNLRFTTMSKVKSLWNNLRVASYTTQDEKPVPQRNYYRIIAVTAYGERIRLDQKDLYNDSRTKVRVRNMTSQLDITIENSHMEDIYLVLYDMNGRPLKTSKISKQSYFCNTKFDLQGLPAGSYVIGINSPHIRYAGQVAKPQ